MDQTSPRHAVQVFINADRWSTLEAAIWDHREALFSAAAPEVFQLFRESYHDDPDALAVIDARIEQFGILRSRGIRSLYAHLQGYGREMLILPEVIEDLQAVRTEEEYADVLDRHPELVVFLQHLKGAGLAPPDQPSRGPAAQMREVMAVQSALPEQQIDVIARAIEATDRDLFPDVLGSLYEMLGRAWAANRQIPEAERLARSEAIFDAAEALMPPAERPIEWARLQVARGNALITNGAARAAGPTRQAIRHYEDALAFLREDKVPTALDKAVLDLDGDALARERAPLTMRLAELYCQRPDDAHLDPAMAERELREVLDLFVREEDQTNEAQARLLLAQIAVDRASDDPDRGIAEALSQLDRALSLAEQCDNSRLTAIAHLKTGWVIRRDIDITAREARLTEAEAHFTAATQGFDTERDPELWAQAQLGLVNVALDLHRDGEFDRVCGLLDEIQALGGPGDHAQLKAAAHAACAKAHRAWPDRSQDAGLAEATQHLSRALELYDAASYPTDTRNVLRDLADLHLESGDWEAAHDAFARGIEITEDLIAKTRSVEGLRHEIARSTKFHAPAAYCLLRLQRPEEALLLLERSRSRLYRRLIEPSNPLEEAGPGVSRFEDIVERVPEGGACVVFLLWAPGSAAIIVPSGARELGADHVVDLPHTDMGYWRFLQKTDAGPGWLDAMMDWRRGGDHQLWLDAVEQTCARLWSELMQPVQDRLHALGIAADAPVVLLPAGPVSLLPLHAATRTEDGRCVMDAFTVSYATCFSSLGPPAKARDLPTKLTSIVDPLGDLPFAAMEDRLISGSFAPGDSRRLSGPAATIAAVLDAIPGSTHLNLACHGFFHWREPENSALILAGNRTLTLRDLVASDVDLTGIRLLTLSGCETGVPQFYRRVVRNIYTFAGDEPVSMPMIWTAAGARAVVSALWPIDDFPTALLVGEFYRRHIGEGKPVALALREAQGWLRDWDRDALLDRVEDELRAAPDGADAETGERLKDELLSIRELLTTDYAAGDRPFEHPYYWAAFVAMGNVQADQA